MKRLFLVSTILFCTTLANAQNPFEAYGYTPKIATLSNGKYNEFHDLDTIVQIGTVLFNTQSKQIVAFLQIDTLYSEATLQPDIVSMWLSPDPLSDENQGISPYNYCHWNPIVITDPDGNDDNDPYWHDKITDQIVHTNQDSPPTTKGDWEYMGETITSIDNNGNTEYHDQYNKVHNSVSLTGPDIIDEKCNYDESAAASAFVDGYEKALYELALFWAGNEAINVACKIVAPLARMAYASLFAKTAATEGTQIIAANGSKIVGFTSHAVNRAIERGITPSSILGALKNPLKIGEVVIDDLGRASQRFIGGSAEVVVNPQTGRIISVNPTSSAKAAKLLKQLGQ